MAAPIQELPPDYYLDNFQYLLSFVVDHYGSRLSVAERDWHARVTGLPEPARRLYIRLVMRRGPVFRVARLSYPEIGDIDCAVDDLLCAGLGDNCDAVPTVDLLATLTRPDLLALPADEKPPAGLRKDGLVTWLAERDVRPTERFISLDGLEHLRVFKLFFFGNLRQDFTEFVLNDLGVTPFEKYAVDPASNWLTDRELVDQALVIDDLSAVSHAVVHVGDVLLLTTFASLLPAPPEQPRLRSRYDRIVNRVARQLERIGAFEDAAALFRRSLATPARERRARVAVAQGDYRSAEDICTTILDTPLDEQEQEFAIRFLHKIRRHCDTVLPASSVAWLQYRPVTEEICLSPSEVRVEQAAVAWYEEHGADAYYVENSLVPGLFGLTFWDIIFSPADNAFYNPFQRGPEDLFTPEFRSRGAAAINARLDLTRDLDRWSALVFDTFEQKYGITNHFVHWSWLDPGLLRRFMLSPAGLCLGAVFDRMLRDLRQHRSGFPDLVVFRDGDCRLVEVKGPGDKLQEHQRRWLRFFDEIGLPASVLNVSYTA